MVEEVFYKSDYVSLILDESNSLIKVEWHGHVISNNYRDTMDLALQLAIEKNLKKWLANMKDLVRIQLQDVDWREKVWYPKFLQSNIEKIAVVISNDYFNEQSIIDTIEICDPNSKIKRGRFLNTAEAEMWLKSV